MTDITEFIDEHDLSVADVIDALDIDAAQFEDVPDEPTDFYDGEPDIEDLREDFLAVDTLAEEHDELQAKAESLEDEVTEIRKTEFADKAERLAELTDRYEEEDLLEQFEDDEMTVDEIDEKIELVEDIKGEDVTTVDSEDGSDDSGSDPDFETTPAGKPDLRKQTRISVE